jgi:thiol oxidase
MAKFGVSVVVVVALLSILYEQTNALSLTPADRRLYEDLKAGRGLYNSDDKVTVLNVTNFKRSVHGTRNAWIIEFYNSWCGFCHRFAALWKSLATDIYGNFISLFCQ